MSGCLIARRCIDLLNAINGKLQNATAFGPEARYLFDKLAGLPAIFEEILAGRYQDAAYDAALESIEGSLRNFCMASERCSAQGPLETLLTAEHLAHQLVDSCLRVRSGIEQLLRAEVQLPTVMRAQASLILAQLLSSTVDFETLRRLLGVRLQLQEEAERIRLGLSDSDAFRSQLQRLAARCSQQQLAADVTFLSRRRADAAADQQAVAAHFLQLALDAVQALEAAHGGGEQPRPRADALDGASSRCWPEQSTAAVSMASSRSGSASLELEKQSALSAAGSVASAMAQLGVASTPPAERVSALRALCRALEGPDRHDLARVLASGGGVPRLLHLVAISAPGHQRRGALRALSALLAAEPDCGGYLVAARGVPVLLHLLTTCIDGAARRAAAAAAAQWEANVPAVAAVRLVPRSPLGKKALGGGAAAAVRRQAGGDAAAPPHAWQLTGGTDGEQPPVEEAAVEAEEEEEEVCLLAVTLLRQLSHSHMAELVAAGVAKALCRMAGVPGGGRLAGAAAAALSDLASDGPTAVQLMAALLLVPLASMRLSGRPSESTAALACTVALLQHPARLRLLLLQLQNAPSTQRAPSSQHSGDNAQRQQDQQQQQQEARGQDQEQQERQQLQLLCCEMGRACDAASMSVLLDLAVEVAAAAGGDTPVAKCSGGIEPGLWQLLPCCVHNAETRGSVLRHSAAMELLLGRMAGADAAAAATLRRVANDGVSKTAVARRMSQILTAGGAPPGSRQAAAVALCLADVLRPASRDRSVARWSADACSECEQCGAVQSLLAIAASPDASCRAAALACLHALALYGTQAVRTALGACGAVMCLVDAVKLEAVALPDGGSGLGLGLHPPICEPHTLGQAAVEALAALATASDALREDIAMQLVAFLGSASVHLAASACTALLALLEAAPAVGPSLVSYGVMATLVAHLSKQPPPGFATAVASARAGAAAAVDPCDALELVQQRTVQLLWVLCRGGGSAVEAAVAAGAPQALLRRLGNSGAVASNVTAAAATAVLTHRIDAAAALGPLLKKSAAAREGVGGGGGLTALLQLVRDGAAAEAAAPLWEEALGALAALTALHAPCRAEAARALRQMLLLRGGARGEEAAAAAALVVARMSGAAAGREVVLAEDLAEPLIRLLSSGDDRARTAAANAICHLAVPAAVQLPPCAALPAGGAIRPRLALVRGGAAAALLGLLRDAAEAPTSSAASGCTAASFTSSAISSSSAAASSTHRSVSSCGGTATTGTDAVLVAAAEALESLAAGEEGVQAIRAAGGVEVLKATAARGKRRLVPAPAARAASAALLQCV